MPSNNNAAKQDFESRTEEVKDNLLQSDEKLPIVKVETEIVWRNVFLMAYLHMGAVYGVYLCVTSAQLKTMVAAYFMYLFGGMGITAGAHRLWAHRTYKAKLPFRIILAFMQTFAVQNNIHEWSRDHRVHHKFSETDADPHNALRGFFFSHVGWLLCKKHPHVISKGKQIDCSDILADPVVRFQKNHYLKLVALIAFVIPTAIPMFFWGETFYNSFFICALLRYCVTLHATWLVNSAAHMWGNKPYDKNINPSENLLVSIGAGGEGFHNYHHTFPWDYSTSEYGFKFNLTTIFIDTFALIGWAYDRKKVPKQMIDMRKKRTGEQKENWSKIKERETDRKDFLGHLGDTCYNLINETHPRIDAHA